MSKEPSLDFSFKADAVEILDGSIFFDITEDDEAIYAIHPTIALTLVKGEAEDAKIVNRTAIKKSVRTGQSEMQRMVKATLNGVNVYYKAGHGIIITTEDLYL